MATIASNMARSSSTRRNPRTDAVTAAYQAIRGSRSPESAHTHEQRLRSQSLTLMAVYRRHSPERGERWLLDLRAALADELVALTPELISEVQGSDQLEDTVEHCFLLTNDPAELARWERAKVVEIADAQRLLLAIRQKREAVER